MRDDNLWTAVWEVLTRAWWGKLLISAVLLGAGIWLLDRAAGTGAGWFGWGFGLLIAGIGLGYGAFGIRQWRRRRHERQEAAARALAEWSGRNQRVDVDPGR